MIRPSTLTGPNAPIVHSPWCSRIGAFTAGRMTRLVERWLTPRGVLAACVGVLGLVCLGPITAAGQWALWLAALGARG